MTTRYAGPAPHRGQGDDLGTLSADRGQRHVSHRFYLGWSLVMAAVIIVGFSRTVPDDVAAPHFPLLLGVHGAVFTAWIGVSIVQPILVATGRRAWHRRIGWAGAGLAAAMVGSGAAATAYAIATHNAPAFFPKGVFLAFSLLGILVFGVLVLMAVRLRRQPDWHKRLMLCATASILAPGLARALPMDSFGALAPLALVAANDVILLAGPAADLIVRGRPHPAYGWGVGLVMLSQALIGPLGFSPLATLAIRALGG